jgi:hypothetical protein
MWSQLVIVADDRRCSFAGCQAIAGGAVAAIESDVLCRDADFVRNTAFFESGAFVVKSELSVEKVAFFGGCNFEACRAPEIFGALGIIGIADATVDSCSFAGNGAGTGGGAVGRWTRICCFSGHISGITWPAE